ncbi:MAG TPA: TylF/MycF/NovP-related O-methyltransferase [Bacteroidales bacterium]|nr:class I SAM-dependent methyltransferase [Bacteroidales bacterium]HPB24156.1 TylF/MycF/NovP-related O-methyltransferase [Bacteroidales bacterium]HPI29564.1 TylF/MycF/NovP-related O-methyltransferase [Bacteroidales bacterium]HQN14753.1 TylF/MycF/NovP-related O-methyltransferase [Bacteroidales bacterium]HQP14447.1 TylF/MycF/NovP-related O-methyltransferase [Bacteroidales bacterium]
MPLDKTIQAEANFRRNSEKEAVEEYAHIFDKSTDTTASKLQNFIKYVRRQDITKLLARYEIFKKVLHTKGSIVECGVFKGAGLMSWALFSDMLEPVNLTRRIYGFDTFEGFPNVNEKDNNLLRNPGIGDLKAEVYDELSELIRVFDKNRFLGHISKVSLVKGDVCKTIPDFIEKNQHLMVSLLFLDMDLYEPTKAAIQNFVPRMPQGSIIAFDELDNPIWPGETVALLETLGINKLALKRLDFDPYIAYAEIP